MNEESTCSSPRETREGETQELLRRRKKPTGRKTLTSEEIADAEEKRYTPKRISVPIYEGQKFSRLTVRFIFRGEQGPQCVCDCECGNVIATSASHLRHNHTRSCGCYFVEQLIQNKTKHGYARKDAVQPEHIVWSSMRRRCQNPKDSSYPNYGGRGIKVCKRWEKFENFIKDMGNKPSPCHSIERKNVNGNYCKSNCRWATVGEQASNKRNNVYLTYNGRTQTASQWQRELGFRPGIVHRRKELGWSDSRIIETPTNDHVIRLQFNGETKTIPEWATKLNIPYKVIHSRRNKGWSTQRILSTPTRKTNAIRFI